MGGANNICSDKTGTLTKNKMTWTQIWCGNDFRIKETSGLESINLNNYVPSEFSRTLLTQCVCCDTIGDL
jgi:magnesium-transporting ATPase (P-type)